MNQNRDLDYRIAAHDYFIVNKTKKYYWFDGEQYESDTSAIVSLSDEQIYQLHDALVNNYDELPFYELLEEETDFYDQLDLEDGFIPLSMEFTPYYECRLRLVDADIESKSRIDSVSVFLTEEEYMDLLLWKMHCREASFYQLALDHPKLYRSVFYRLAEPEYLNWRFKKGFVIQLSEIDEAVLHILGEGSISIALEPDEKVSFGFISIEDKKVSMLVQYDRTTDPAKPFSERIEDIDVAVLHDHFKTSDSKSLLETLQKQYSSVDLIEQFRQLLEDKGIRYEYEILN